VAEPWSIGVGTSPQRLKPRGTQWNIAGLKSPFEAALSLRDLLWNRFRESGGAYRCAQMLQVSPLRQTTRSFGSGRDDSHLYTPRTGLCCTPMEIL
jgi:hypothetical protein